MVGSRRDGRGHGAPDRGRRLIALPEPDAPHVRRHGDAAPQLKRWGGGFAFASVMVPFS